MPKIIDHQRHKRSLSERAAQLFLRHGYSQLGMRQLAQELGLSKSALYHYFPSKEALFSASIEVITQQDMALSTLSVNASHEERVEALVLIMQQIEQRFSGELGLVLDYIRGMNSEQIRHNPQMQLAEQRYLELIAQYVGEAQAKHIYHLLLGAMLGRLMDGQSTSWDEIRIWLNAAIKN